MRHKNPISTMLKRSTLDAVSRETGIPRSSLENYVYGKVSPPLDRAVLIAKACGYRFRFEFVRDPQITEIET